MAEGGVVMLASDGASTRILFHALEQAFGNVHVVMEQPIPRMRLVRGRLRRLPWLTVAGQLAFQVLGQPLLRRAAGARVQQLLREHGLTDAPIPADRVVRVASANDDDAREALHTLAPAVVVVNGTRILGRRTLESLSCPVINTHAGITPLYRGVHGAYWALAEGRPELAGTTVHYVDKGVDTGPVIAQATFRVSPQDNFAVYPYLHTAAGAPLLVDAVRRALDGTLAPAGNLPELPSVLRYHPTLWGYLYARFRRGVR